MTHILHIAKFSESVLPIINTDLDNRSYCDYFQKLEGNACYYSFNMYKELIVTFCECFNIEIESTFGIKRADNQYFWIFSSEHKDALISILERFTSNHANAILKGIKDLVHNRQIYVNITSIDHIQLNLEKAIQLLNTMKENEIILFLAFNKASLMVS